MPSTSCHLQTYPSPYPAIPVVVVDIARGPHETTLALGARFFSQTPGSQSPPQRKTSAQQARVWAAIVKSDISLPPLPFPEPSKTTTMAVNRIRGAFAVPRKGETFELRAGLVSQYAYERKEAIQKTIMAMTLGKDVSALFPDVLKNIATGDLDQKKLVYLYLM